MKKADRNQEKTGEKEEVKGGKKEITGLETSFSLTRDPAVCLQEPAIPLYISTAHPLGLSFPVKIRVKADCCGTYNRVKLCSCFGSCLCCKYRRRIRDVQMSAELEPGFGDWLCVMFQMLLLRLPKLAAVSGSL